VNTVDLIAETDHIQNEDVKQEYLTLRLEGHSPQQATIGAGPADPMATRNKQRGPLVNDQRPIVSDFREYTNLISFTLDNRSDDDRAIEWAAIDHATHTVNNLLDRIPPLQAETVRIIYGLGTGQPVNCTEAAKRIGTKTSTVASRIKHAHNNMKKIAETYTDRPAA
jgi:DNA-directed RNA polymerase specialized sigma24 family protein